MMRPEVLVYEVVCAHRDWSRLAAGEREQSLRLHLARYHQDLFQALQARPEIMRVLPAHVLADWIGQQKRGVGLAALQALMPAIARQWLQERSEGNNVSFEAYSRALLREHRTARALRAYLDLNTGGAKR